MIGLGTLINTAAIIGGGVAGMLTVKEEQQQSLSKACGVSVLFIKGAYSLSYPYFFLKEALRCRQD